jgi:hypothetical protein
MSESWTVTTEGLKTNLGRKWFVAQYISNRPPNKGLISKKAWPVLGIRGQVTISKWPLGGNLCAKPRKWNCDDRRLRIFSTNTPGPQCRVSGCNGRASNKTVIACIWLTPGRTGSCTRRHFVPESRQAERQGTYLIPNATISSPSVLHRPRPSHSMMAISQP